MKKILPFLIMCTFALRINAQILSLNGIPFNVDEKQLKTLPKALSDDMIIFISRQKEVIA